MYGERNGRGKRSHSNSDYPDRGGNKRRNAGDDRESFTISSEDTVYRFLCPIKKIGSIIGRGGDIVKQLRLETKSKIRIGETVARCDERVVTIYSSSEETNAFENSSDYVCPAQDALFKIHDRVAAEDKDEDSEGSHQVTLKLLVPSDQIGCIIGKGGQIVQNIRSDTGAQIRILKDDHLPACALSSDEMIQISGDALLVKKALHQITQRLHDNPSRSQHLLVSIPSMYSSDGSGMRSASGGRGPVMGIAPMVDSYGGYKGDSRDWPRPDSRDWPRPFYSAPRDESSSKEFNLRMICAIDNVGAVIGKGGVIINQIRQESRASINVDSSSAEGDSCLITLSSKEFFEDRISPTIEAAIILQPRCSDKAERDSGIVSYTTRILVPSSRIGCLIGKGGAIITELRKLTNANIRILSKESLPKIASADDDMVQISGDLNVCKDALVQVCTRLRANFFDREGAMPAFVPVLPYIPMPADSPSDGYPYKSREDVYSYGSRDSKRHVRESPYSGAYGGARDYPVSDRYGGYRSQAGGSPRSYGPYDSYSLGRTGGPGLSAPNPPRRRDSGY